MTASESTALERNDLYPRSSKKFEKCIYFYLLTHFFKQYFYSQDQDKNVSDHSNSLRLSNSINSTMVTKGVPTFPSKLHNMLQAVTNEGSQVVMWLPRNDGFFILDEQAFINTIVPVYFNLTKMRSFTRQLNLWGFSR